MEELWSLDPENLADLRFDKFFACLSFKNLLELFLTISFTGLSMVSYFYSNGNQMTSHQDPNLLMLKLIKYFSLNRYWLIESLYQYFILYCDKRMHFQVITNACATQAILSILLNCKHPDLVLGNTLTEFRDFCQTFDATMKGLTLSNSQAIRSVHNSFAKLVFLNILAT